MISLIIFIALIGLISYYLVSNGRRRNFPPGPMPIPIFGNLLSLGPVVHKKLGTYSKKYGQIVGIQMGMTNAIVVHGTKLIREAFNDPRFNNKFDNETICLLQSKYGILQAADEIWTEQRRFCLRKLRDFGFGRKTMEELISQEVKDLCDWLKLQQDEPVELKKRLNLAVVNSLWKIITGERFDHDDKQLLEIIDQLEKTLQALTTMKSLGSLLLFVSPAVAKFFPDWSGWNALVESGKPKRKIFRRIIAEHLETLPLDEPRDFVDAYLLESKTTTNVNSPLHPNTASEALESVMEDLFGAGTGTTSTTLSWAFLYLLYHPHVQNNLHSELDRVVGKSRLVNLSDRKNLPYMEAFVLETLRMSSMLCLGSLREASENFVFNGYDIPKGTIMIGNLYENHHNVEIWGDPEVFRPERFLTLDGTTIERNEALVPFSVGRRSCLGETLARDSLFLFIAQILQIFRIGNGEVLPSLDPQEGVILSPQPYKVRIYERNL